MPVYTGMTSRGGGRDGIDHPQEYLAAPPAEQETGVFNPLPYGWGSENVIITNDDKMWLMRYGNF
ncbi:MAG: hypothetical protein JXD22_12430 [Sedimentisphaerales bacterium]|nr:hypothetical protein [Sedimentisphaerales bacterium]